MVFSCMLGGLLHETTEGGKHVDRRVDLLIMELSVDEDLPLSDVPRQIWDRVGDIVILHYQ